MAGDKKKSPAKKTKKNPLSVTTPKPKPKKRGRGRPKKLAITPEALEAIADLATTIDIDPEKLQMLAGLARIDCTDYEIATVLNVDMDTWTKFKNKDFPEVGEFVERNRVNGNVSLRRTQKDVSKERIRNTCQECGKMAILEMARLNRINTYDGVKDVEAFLLECPYCGSEDIKHEYMQPNTTMLVWLGKQTLGQSDKLDQKISGDADAPLVVSTLAEFVKNAAKKREAAAASRNSNSR